MLMITRRKYLEGQVPSEDSHHTMIAYKQLPSSFIICPSGRCHMTDGYPKILELPCRRLQVGVLTLAISLSRLQI